MRRSELLRLSASFLVWWIVCFGLWWALVGAFSFTDLVAGLLLATAAAVAGALVTSYGLVRGRSVGRALRIAPSVVRAMVVDFGIVTGVLVRAVLTGQRRRVGAFVRRPADELFDTRDPSRRAWVTIAATYSPNSYVVDIDRDTGEVLLHDLSPRRSSESPA